ELDNTTKRLEITTILANLIKELSPDEIDKAIYLSLGYLKAEFESEKFNIAEKMMVRILAQAYKTDEKEISQKYSQMGDLGSVAESLATKKASSDLEINDVHKKLLEIAQIKG